MPPTFSPSLTSAPILFDSIVALSQKHDWQWKIKFHPKMDKETVMRYRQAQHPKLNVVEGSCISPLLQEGDVMISDTSSAITEFLLMRKPVVTYKNAQPEDVLINIDNVNALEAGVNQALMMEADLKDKINAYCNEMHPYNDGKSARRVLQATLDEIAHFPRQQVNTKPINWFRNLKLRKQLGYWSI